ncbi:MAG: hypothetical protein ACI8TQ_002661 [Planctomycetota bacterium]|jgi:hypothetical protein
MTKADKGKQKAKKERKALLLRLSPEIHEDLQKWAAQDMRSLNAHIEFLLRDALRRRKGGKGASG